MEEKIKRIKETINYFLKSYGFPGEFENYFEIVPKSLGWYPDGGPKIVEIHELRISTLPREFIEVLELLEYEDR